MYALIDCNNFYASCERLFRPDLRNKAVVVLSNNDGCAIARSNEAKALGIKMGDPYFQIKEFCKENNIHIFSSNYTLYGDLSSRVMGVIEQSCPDIEVYSIDEAFIDMKTVAKELREPFCQDLQKRILKEVGIPTSIGIGSTKTLAKLANHIAKKKLKTPVFSIDKDSFWLEKIDIRDVWGIGAKLNERLNAQGIYNARELAKQNPHLIKSRYNVILMRTVMELQGASCLGLDDPEPKQSIFCAKSFGDMQSELSVIEEALSSYVAKVCEKMRKQNCKAMRIQVFLMSNRFRRDLRQYSNRMDYQFIHPTNDVRVITGIAKSCLNKIFRKGIYYKKVGFGVLEMMDAHQSQGDLFSPMDTSKTERSSKLMKTLDSINKRFGDNTLHVAACGFDRKWALKSDLCSPAYTTRWSDIPIVKAC